MYKCFACLTVLFLIHACALADYAATSSNADQPWEVSSPATGSTAVALAFPASAGTAQTAAPTMSVASSDESKNNVQLKFKPPATPEPGSLVLLSLVGLGGAIWRRKRK